MRASTPTSMPWRARVRQRDSTFVARGVRGQDVTHERCPEWRSCTRCNSRWRSAARLSEMLLPNSTPHSSSGPHVAERIGRWRSCRRAGASGRSGDGAAAGGTRAFRTAGLYRGPVCGGGTSGGAVHRRVHRGFTPDNWPSREVLNSGGIAFQVDECAASRFGPCSPPRSSVTVCGTRRRLPRTKTRAPRRNW